ncbi:MAG: gliding motility-associated C-terminal domain-containing protein, partial [Bacteroidales bacterium]|nr:gliding motility-associated C-terminal domain-containing protein [Bacteroidales bacterium]
FYPDNTSPNSTYTPTARELMTSGLQLTATATNNGNCNAVSDNVIITFTDQPIVNTGNDKTVCANNPTVQLQGSVIGATDGIWTGGNGTFIPNNTTLNATYLPSQSEIEAGIVTLTLTSTGNGNCNPVSDQMTITITPAPFVNAGDDITVCENNPTVQLNGTIGISTGGIWSGGNGLFIPNNITLNCTYIPTQSEILSGEVILTLTSTGNGNCNAVSDQVKITILPAPVVEAGPNLTVCYNNPTVQLHGNIQNAGGGYWSGGNGTFYPNNYYLNATYTLTQEELNNNTITLYLTSTENGNCLPETDSIIILVTPPPQAYAGSDITLCANELTFNLSGKITGATGGIWSGGTGQYIPGNNSLNIVYIPSQEEIDSGKVTLILTTIGNGNCLPASDSVTLNLGVNAYPIPNAEFSTDKDIYYLPNDPVVITNNSSGAVSYIWDFGDGTQSYEFSPIHYYKDFNIYTITLIAINAHQCTDTAYKVIRVTGDLYFPNAFTPNPNEESNGMYDLNDFNNHIFFPIAKGVEEFNMKIYNRWGELIFETNDIKIGWNGYYKGKLCPQDVYVYKAKAKLNDGRIIEKTGDVLLIR